MPYLLPMRSSPPRTALSKQRVYAQGLRRRCLYLWIDYPDLDKELRIVRTKVPDVEEKLARQVCRFVENARDIGLEKIPGISETLDWARALVVLHFDHLDRGSVELCLGALVKDADDLGLFRREAIDGILSKMSEPEALRPPT